MPRRRPPPPPDPERLSRLLAAAREARTARAAAASGLDLEPRVRGWVPQVAPPDVEGRADVLLGAWPWRGVDRDEQRNGAGDGGGDEGGDESGDGGAGTRTSAGRHRRGPRVLVLPTPFHGARLSVPWRAVVALAVLLLLSGGFFAVRVARAQQAAVPQPAGTGALVTRTGSPTGFGAPVTPSGVGATGATGTAGSAGPAGATSGAPPARRVVVDVIGAVGQPGVVSVADGARVGEVLAAAGGVLPGADVRRLNLARIVADGEQIFVPRPGETPPERLDPQVGPGGSATGAAGGTPALVDLNTADLGALDALPGVGLVLAQRILDWRGEHGRFSSVDELGEVTGIGDKLLAQIRPKVRV